MHPIHRTLKYVARLLVAVAYLFCASAPAFAGPLYPYMPSFRPGTYVQGTASCGFTRIDFTTGSLGTASLSRASNGSYLNSGGALTTASTNVARFDYVGGVGPNLLVEPAATNVLDRSNGFGTSPWTANSSAVVASGAFTSPDGTLDGFSLTNGTGFGSIQQNYSVTSGQAYTLSIWAYTISGGAKLLFQIGSVSSTPSTVLTSSAVRYSKTITAGGSSGSQAVFIYNNVSAAAVEGIYGVQMEAGSKATSYIATTTGAITRAADVVTFTQPAGCNSNVYTFSDNTTQTVSQVPGTATVPTNLNEADIKYIDGTT